MFPVTVFPWHFSVFVISDDNCVLPFPPTISIFVADFSDCPIFRLPFLPLPFLSVALLPLQFLS